MIIINEKLTCTGFTIGFGAFGRIYSPAPTWTFFIAWNLLRISWSSKAISSALCISSYLKICEACTRYPVWGMQGIWINLRPQIQCQYVQYWWYTLALQWGSVRMIPDINSIPCMCQVLVYIILMKRGSPANSWHQKYFCYISDHITWASSSQYLSIS